MQPSLWKILLVDDDEDDYVLIRLMLANARWGKYHIDWARNYEYAWEMLHGQVYDVILVDYDLGLRNGLELTQEYLKEDGNIPMILLTGRGSFEVDLEAMQAGATLYLTKSETSSLTLERSIRYAIDQKRIEKKLRESEARYRTILEALPVGVAIFDPQCNLVECNPQAALILGCASPPGQMPDQQPIPSPAQLQEMITAVISGSTSIYNRELTLERSDGSCLPVLASIQPIWESAGKLIGAIATLVNISERKRLERELQASEHEYQELVRYAPAGIYEIDFRSKRFISVNNAMCDLSGYSREEFLEMSPFDLLDNEGKLLFEQRIARWLSGEEPEKNVEYKVTRKDGQQIDVLLNTTFKKDELGRSTGATVIGFDITERKRAEDALRQSEKDFSRLVNTSYEGIWSVDQQGKTTFVNQRAAEILGYTVEEVRGKNAFEFLMAGHVEAGRQTMEMVARGESGRVEAHARHKDGSEIWLLVAFAPIMDDGGQFQGAFAMFSDITENKLAEEALRESEERFRAMADGTPLMIWVTDAQGRIDFINQAYMDFFGVTVEEVQEHGWQPMIHPDDHATYVNSYKECLRAQQPFHAEARVRRKDGEWRWVDSYGQPRFAHSGKFVGMAGSSVDITQRKQMEKALHRYTEQLKRSNQELETFAFTASHDLREPLRKIEKFSKMLVSMGESHLQEQELDYLERMQSAASRMSSMIDDLLVLSRVTSRGLSFSKVDLQAVARTVLDDLEVRLLQNGGKVEMEALPVIQADQMQMQQLFQNLISNALKFHRTGVTPEVWIKARPLPENRVEIQIEDNGIGFNVEQAAHLFQPFKRLHSHSDYEGTGIGLSICRRIVERHGGSITAESVPEKGSVFTVILPTEQ